MHAIFNSENDARRGLMQACARLAPLGIDRGGSLSLRWDRGGAPGLLLTPAVPVSGPDDFVWMSIALEEVGQARPRMQDVPCAPAVEWRLHRDVLAARPQAQAVVHLHAVHAATLACLADVQRAGVPAFHPGLALAGGPDLRCTPDASAAGLQRSREALSALADRRACLLAGDGLLALHDTLEDLVRLAHALEALCRIYWQVLATGAPARRSV